MKKASLIVITVCIVGFTLLAYDVPFKEKEKSTIRRTLSFSDLKGEKTVVIDTIFGSIEVVGYKGEEVAVVVNKTIRARSRSKIQQAKEEVNLKISETDNTITLYVDGPFRKEHDDCSRRKNGKYKRNDNGVFFDNSLWRENDRICYKGSKYYGYKVIYDFKLKIPYDANVSLKTIGEGKIKVEKIQGDYNIRNVMGDVEMDEVSGAGKARSVSGDVIITFSKNPVSDSYFGTVSGDVELTFCPSLSAYFRLKNMFGEAFSDFPVEYINKVERVEKRKRGKYIYKSERSTYVRIGKGGPEIKLNTLSGDILIIKGKNSKEGG